MTESKKIKLRDTDEFFQRSVKEINKNAIIQEEGLFSDYVSKIRKAFEKQINHVKYDKNVELFENYKNTDNLKYHYEQFLINDWNTSTNKQVEKVVNSIMQGLKQKLDRENAKATVFFKDEINIRDQKFNTEFLEVVENDNLCFYVTYDDIKTKIIDTDTNLEVIGSKKYQFTLWFIYEV